MKVIDEQQKTSHWLFKQLLAFPVFRSDDVVHILLREFASARNVFLTNPDNSKGEDVKARIAIIEYLLETILASDEVYSVDVLSKLAKDILPFVPLLKQGIDESVLNHPSIRLLYEVCIQTRLSRTDLEPFDDALLSKLFEIVEQTRNVAEEKEDYNFSVIRLILALNDQFIPKTIPTKNPVIRKIAERINSSKTLSENVLFMFNRAEDDTVQVLIQKLLYLTFTNPSTSSWFYTNDLNIILDVILRETRACSLDESAVQSGYLRILSPLLQFTPLLSSASFSKGDEVLLLLKELMGDDVDEAVGRLAKRTWDDCRNLIPTSSSEASVARASPPPLPPSQNASPTVLPPSQTSSSPLLPPSQNSSGHTSSWGQTSSGQRQRAKPPLPKGPPPKGPPK